MARGDQIGRQWRVLQTLITSKRGRSAAELECHPRTVYRDKEYGKFRENINLVNEAALERRRVEILYYAMSQRKKTKRKVDPYRIWFFKGTFYLIGFCHLRQEIRTFALDRIRMLSPIEETFQVPEDFKLEDFLKTSFGVFQGKPRKVKIRFAPEVAGYIQEKVWHESQKIRIQKEGSILFEAEVAGTDEIEYWIMTWGAKAEVLAPASLREEIRRDATRHVTFFFLTHDHVLLYPVLTRNQFPIGSR